MVNCSVCESILDSDSGVCQYCNDYTPISVDQGINTIKRYGRLPWQEGHTIQENIIEHELFFINTRIKIKNTKKYNGKLGTIKSPYNPTLQCYTVLMDNGVLVRIRQKNIDKLSILHPKYDLEATNVAIVEEDVMDEPEIIEEDVMDESEIVEEDTQPTDTINFEIGNQSTKFELLCDFCSNKIEQDWNLCPHCGVKLKQIISNDNQSIVLPFSVQKSTGKNIFKHFEDKIIESGLNPKKVIAAIALSAIFVTSIILYFLIDDDEYEAQYSSATGYILIESIEVDNGESDRLFEVDIYYDERNRNEFNTGYECDALEYYDFPRTYYLDELCVLYFADPFVEEVTFGACAEYVSSGRSYDISPHSTTNSGCVKVQTSIYNRNGEKFVIKNDCTYDGELLQGSLYLAKLFTFSGFDDGDSNNYNGEISGSLAFEITYECVKV